MTTTVSQNDATKGNATASPVNEYRAELWDEAFGQWFPNRQRRLLADAERDLAQQRKDFPRHTHRIIAVKPV